MKEDHFSALVQGRRRVEIVRILEVEPYLVVEARPVTDDYKTTKQLTALMRTARNMFEQCVDMDDSLPEEAQLYSMNIDEPGWLVDMIASSLSLPQGIRKNCY